MKNIFKKYYKTNFHIHLTGSILQEDLSFGLLEINHKEIDDIFFKKEIWNLKKDLLVNDINLFKSIILVAERESNDKVKYLEITINCLGLFKRGIKKEHFLKQLCDANKYCQSIFGICVKYKLGINRKDKIEDSLMVLEIYKALPKDIVVCIDINGNERKRPYFDFDKIINIINHIGAPISVHAGEFLGLEFSLKQAISIKPMRIAHAFSVINNNNLLNCLKNKNIIIEICPTSSYLMNPFASIFYKTQVFDLLKIKSKLVFGNDNPALFKNSISDDFLLLHKYGLSEFSILKMINFGLLKSNINQKLVFIIYNIMLYFFSKIKNIFKKLIFF